MIKSIFIWLPLSIIIMVLLIILIISYYCYKRIFFSKRKKVMEKYPVISDEIYLDYKDQLINYMKQVDELPYIDCEIKSFDGLTLRAKFFEYEKGAPIELMMHGYRGSARRDLSSGVLRCHKCKRSCLLIDHRASGYSDGKNITFGALEHKDALLWIDYIINNIDKDAKILLTGISMGASTALITAGCELPKNVCGVLADCGYTSAKEIIKKVIKDMKLPANIFYPFVVIAAKLFAKFNIKDADALNAMKKCKIPVIFIHGDNDLFVPYEMSVKNYNACISNNKKLVTINNAGHGLAYMVNPDKYLEELKNFFNPILYEEKVE